MFLPKDFVWHRFVAQNADRPKNVRERWHFCIYAREHNREHNWDGLVNGSVARRITGGVIYQDREA